MRRRRDLGNGEKRVVRGELGRMIGSIVYLIM